MGCQHAPAPKDTRARMASSVRFASLANSKQFVGARPVSSVQPGSIARHPPLLPCLHVLHAAPASTQIVPEPARTRPASVAAQGHIPSLSAPDLPKIAGFARQASIHRRREMTQKPNASPALQGRSLHQRGRHLVCFAERAITVSLMGPRLEMSACSAALAPTVTIQEHRRSQHVKLARRARFQQSEAQKLPMRASRVPGILMPDHQHLSAMSARLTQDRRLEQRLLTTARVLRATVDPVLVACALTPSKAALWGRINFKETNLNVNLALRVLIQTSMMLEVS